MILRQFPYEQVHKFSCEYTKKHRITQGGVVIVASLGAGAIVMLTKPKSHWLYIDDHEQNVPKSVVLRGSNPIPGFQDIYKEAP